MVVAAAIIAVGAVWYAQRPAGVSVDLGAANAQSSGDVDTAGVLEMSLGNPDADVTVIEYASFTCPHCKNFHNGPFKQLKSEYMDTGKINFIYREVYFDKYGLWAGMVARCGGPEKYFGIADLLYETQAEWAKGSEAQIGGNLRKIGLNAGIDADKLDACFADGDMARAMVAVFQETSTADGINSTPSFVIDGKKYSNMAYDDFAAILDEKLGQ